MKTMDEQKKYELCQESLEDFVRRLGFSEVLVGLSGGIDSALSACMCVDAFGADKVHGVLLPGPHTSEHANVDARDAAQRLGIEASCISITESYESFAQSYKEGIGRQLEGIAAENTQARFRMIALMALSNMFGWLLINTSNKSETAMGYSTLYGDTAGAYAPLGGIYKTDVWALARWRNEKAELEGKVFPIPKNSIEKAPSAELSPSQTDEESLGVSYETLDPVLIALVEQGKSCEEVAAMGFSLSDVLTIERTYRASAFKRALEPPFPQAKFY